jgi:hypothetical protein
MLALKKRLSHLTNLLTATAETLLAVSALSLHDSVRWRQNNENDSKECKPESATCCMLKDDTFWGFFA